MLFNIQNKLNRSYFLINQFAKNLLSIRQQLLISYTFKSTEHLIYLSVPAAFSVHHPGFTRWAEDPTRSQPALPVRLLRVWSPWKPLHLSSRNDRGKLCASPWRVRATGQGALPPEEDCWRNGAEDRYTETHANRQVKLNRKILPQFDNLLLLPFSDFNSVLL